MNVIKSVTVRLTMLLFCWGLAVGVVKAQGTAQVSFGTVESIPFTTQNNNLYNPYSFSISLTSITQGSSNFTVSAASTVAAARQIPITVKFNPTTFGTYSTTAYILYSNIYRITVNISGTYAEQASGYVNPKYVVVGVTYAPPGPQSNVTYTNSTLVGNTLSLSNSFTAATMQSTAVTQGLSIAGYAGGTQTATDTNGFSQKGTGSASVTISKTTSQSDKTPGPLNAYIGVDHDYDYIWIWLNPVLLYTVTGNPNTPTSPNNLQWRGFGYSTLDPAGVEIYGIWVGYLNGDLGPIPQDIQSVLNRTWAPKNVDGTGPALTSADLQAIMKSDPYWQCGMTSHPLCPTTVDNDRFTQTDNSEDVLYQQPPPGGQPGTQTYTLMYTTTSTGANETTYTWTMGWAIESVFSADFFGNSFKDDLKSSTTLTWESTYNNSITNTQTQSAMLSVTGPPCTVSGGKCSPVYMGPTEYDVYEDNIYGTFLFNPVN
jgi:hypothetical protein